MKNYRELTQNDIDKFDYFKDGEKEFYSKLENCPMPRLVQGKHRKNPPLISVIITTYKRPELLKNAIDSALDQGEFCDYQIIIVDNECAPIEEETETSRLVGNYTDERIIYYRNEIEALYKMDNGVRLAKSKWILFLHDDDILASNSLQIRLKLVTRYPEIKFLSSNVEDFFDYDIPKCSKCDLVKYKLYKYPSKYIDREYYTGVLGALIDRKAFIQMCGMQVMCTGIADMAMYEKFHFFVGVYSVDVGMPLYYYRRWQGQSLEGDRDDSWQYVYRNEYFLQKYIVRKCHSHFIQFWDRINAYKIIAKAERGEECSYKAKVNINMLIAESGMPKGADNKKSIRYRIDKRILKILNFYVYQIYRPLIDEGIVEC